MELIPAPGIHEHRFPGRPLAGELPHARTQFHGALPMSPRQHFRIFGESITGPKRRFKPWVDSSDWTFEVASKSFTGRTASLKSLPWAFSPYARRSGPHRCWKSHRKRSCSKANTSWTWGWFRWIKGGSLTRVKTM